VVAGDIPSVTLSGAGDPEHRHGVLLVEDDYDTREAFVTILETLGLTVVGAANGREALERLWGGLRPCLIILDIAMPEMDGYAFRRAQLADPTLTGIPVAVMSGAGWAVERDARALGLTTFLRKPIDPDQLLATLGDCVA